MLLLPKKINVKVFFSKEKRKKTFGGKGPFLKENGDQIADSETEALRKTYEKAFSKPNKENLVGNPNVFFATSSNEIKIDSIHITRDDIKDSINELSNNDQKVQRFTYRSIANIVERVHGNWKYSRSV